MLRLIFPKPPVAVSDEEMALRRETLRVLSVLSALIAVFYLGLGTAGGLRSGAYPWDGVLLGVSALFGWRVWQRNPSPRQIIFSASWFLALGSQPFFYLSQAYGIQSLVNAAFVFSILAAGLLIGVWFISYWTLGMCAWMAVAGWGQLTGRWAIHAPLTPSEYWSYLLFWWAVFGGTGGLAWLFARYLERSLQASQRKTAALVQTTNALVANPALDEFLGQVLTVIAEQMQVHYACLWFHDPERDEIAPRLTYVSGEVRADRHLHSDEPPPTPAIDVPLWQELVRTRRVIVIDDVANDPRLKYRQPALADGVRTVLLVPLILGEAVIGFFNVNTREGRRYRPEELEVAQALAQQMTLAIQLTRLAEQSQRSAVLEERNRLAREIHDTLAQGFTGIVVQLEAAEDALTDSPPTAAEHLTRARKLARESLAEARRSVRALRPIALEGRGLAAALRDSIYALSTGAGLTVKLSLAESLPTLPAETEAELLRIGQEAVTNVIKHAQAKTITVNLHYRNNLLTLEVCDDGRGFDPDNLPPSETGFGLIGIRERAKRLNGKFTLTSHPASGTTLTIQSPISTLSSP